MFVLSLLNFMEGSLKLVNELWHNGVDGDVFWLSMLFMLFMLLLMLFMFLLLVLWLWFLLLFVVDFLLFLSSFLNLLMLVQAWNNAVAPEEIDVVVILRHLVQGWVLLLGELSNSVRAVLVLQNWVLRVLFLFLLGFVVSKGLEGAAGLVAGLGLESADVEGTVLETVVLLIARNYHVELLVVDLMVGVVMPQKEHFVSGLLNFFVFGDGPGLFDAEFVEATHFVDELVPIGVLNNLKPLLILVR